MDDLKNKRVTVVGLGHFGGGIGVSKWLVSQGAKVLVTDLARREKLEEGLRELEGMPIEYRLGEHREEDFTSAQLVVASPAVPPGNRFLAAARAAGVSVTTEIRLFIERCPARIVGVTGTKGKSTATAMLGRMLAQRFKTHVGGNIGKSLLFELPRIAGDDVIVLELSSFMLEYLAEAKWSPQVALVTMLAADHLDRHKTVEAYLDAKMNIVRFQKSSDFAVLNEESEECRRFASATAAKVSWYGVEGRRPFELKVQGRHNQLNAQGAYAAAACLGVAWEEAQNAVGEFTGLPHRLCLVHEEAGVRYFDDSIATIPQAAVAAMDSFPAGRVIQIVGGSDKNIPLDQMARELAGRAKAILCIGQTGPAIANAAREARGRAQVHECGTLAAAMEKAKELAKEGDVVLLSTGCASYDQFSNFEARGDAFAELAKKKRAGGDAGTTC